MIPLRPTRWGRARTEPPPRGTYHGPDDSVTRPRTSFSSPAAPRPARPPALPAGDGYPSPGRARRPVRAARARGGNRLARDTGPPGAELSRARLCAALAVRSRLPGAALHRAPGD